MNNKINELKIGIYDVGSSRGWIEEPVPLETFLLKYDKDGQHLHQVKSGDEFKYGKHWLIVEQVVISYIDEIITIRVEAKKSQLRY